jgi:hypothetical protein
MLPFTSVNFISFIHQSSVYNLLQVFIKRAFLLSSFSTPLHPLRREERREKRRKNVREVEKERRRKNLGRERRGGTSVKLWFEPPHSHTHTHTDRHFSKANLLVILSECPHVRTG